MNINKIYKPLKKKMVIIDGIYVVGIEVYDSEDVQELEEKYKELLSDRILQIKNAIADDISAILTEIKLIERHTGMKWEDIIK